jgi:glyoxylase-like metal-dependent hydrolase (beta-lactamase superfamily II)
MPAPPPALEGLTVLERGWLSSNNVLLHGEPGEGATLVDSGHCAHAAQTVALVGHALQGEALARLVNTHLHSDHCGGNAALQRAFGMPIHVPPGQWQAVLRWDEEALSYRPSRQRCERFTPDAQLAPGDTLRCGGRAWHVLAAPGHDPDSVMLFDAAHGVLISADALWENGFGIVFPELDGETTTPSPLRSLTPGGARSASERPGARPSAFDDVAAVLDMIERLPVQWVLPGHGAPFQDTPAALARARSRLAGFRADPARHDRHAAKVLLKFHLLEEISQPLPALREWFGATPLMQGMWRRLGRPLDSTAAWCDALVAELAAGGALAVRDGVAHNN